MSSCTCYVTTTQFFNGNFGNRKEGNLPKRPACAFKPFLGNDPWRACTVVVFGKGWTTNFSFGVGTATRGFRPLETTVDVDLKYGARCPALTTEVIVYALQNKAVELPFSRRHTISQHKKRHALQMLVLPG